MPPHHDEYLNYPTPDHDQLARLLGDPAAGIDGDEWASIVERVLAASPTEQRAIADLIVSLNEKTRDGFVLRCTGCGTTSNTMRFRWEATDATVECDCRAA